MNSSPPSVFARRDGLAIWVYVLVLVGVALTTVVVLLLYQNIVERKAEATQHVFRVVEVDDETGEVRGLLCSNCNCAIGLLGDRPETVRKAAAYLSRRTPSKEGLK